MDTIAFIPKEHPDYPGYYRCDKYPNLAVNREGVIIRIVTFRAGFKPGCIAKIASGKVNTPGGDMSTVMVGVLICTIFYGPPPTNTTIIGGGRHVPRFKDGNKDNRHVDNLEWRLGTTIDKSVNLQKPITVASTEYPGYYICNVFPSIAVSRSGEVVRIDGMDKGVHTMGGRTADGYRRIMTYNHERGVADNTLVHRVVTYTFLGAPTNNGQGELQNQVNHKDGDRSNNNIDNLEWVTNRENALDAYTSDYCDKRLTPLTVLDMVTNVVTEYASRADCSKATGTHCSNVAGKITTVARRYQTQQGHTNLLPWLTKSDSNQAVNLVQITVLDMRDSTTANYPSITDAFKAIGFAPRTIKDSVVVVGDRYQLKPKDSTLPWVEMRYNAGYGHKPLFIIHWETGFTIVARGVMDAVDTLQSQANVTITPTLLSKLIREKLYVVYGEYYFTTLIDCNNLPTREQVQMASQSYKSRLPSHRPVVAYHPSTGKVLYTSHKDLATLIAMGYNIKDGYMPDGYNKYIRGQSTQPFYGYYIRELWQGIRLNPPPCVMTELKQNH